MLFAGDVVFNGCTAYSEEGTLNWIKVLDRIIDDIQPEIVVPGHGAICGVDFVKEQRDYLLNVISEFNKHYNDEIDSLSLTKEIDISRFLHWIQPERLYVTVDILLKKQTRVAISSKLERGSYKTGRHESFFIREIWQSN
ncbi:hypothetical protein OL548_22205 [Lysinibacillus sp. MHQ-1]|nr:hypothetical protein OL548_22205 [Lysinibacillus sp. MHQ-1]